MAQVRMMSRILVLMMLAAGPAFAQQKPAPAPAGKTPPKAAERPQPAPPEGQPVNIRFELTITDQRGEAAPVTKTVMSTVADRSSGRIRTNGEIRIGQMVRQVVLNVDAFPRLLKDGLLKVDLTIDYRAVPASEADTAAASTPAVNETLTIMLQDGKPLLISQSADPATDRKVKVEAKATVLK